MHLNITQKGFQMQWGFLQTQQKMLIQSKVQLISWSSNFVRRLLGIQMFRFYMAGEDLVKTEQHIQLPVMESDTLRKLTEVYQSKWPKDKSPSFTLHHAFGWRSTLLYFLPIAIVASVGVYFWNPWYIFLPILIFIYLTISNWVRFKKFHFWMNNTTIQIQKGIWGEENILLNFNKIQQVSIKTSPFQRRKNLATIELYTAGETVTIPFIPKAQAQYIADWTLLCIEFKQQ
jgi:putative membrane protein